MSAKLKIISWNPFKKTYDVIILMGLLAYIGAFILISKLLYAGETSISDEILIIRSFGSAAIIMLHIILCIGPLARLHAAFKPLLYNRRHLGVSMFFVALVHSILSFVYYHGFGIVSPLDSLFSFNLDDISPQKFPFELLGLVALIIFFLMALTSHDYWLGLFGAPVWKSLHMTVYLAYGLLIGHVSLGVLQSEKSNLYLLFLIMGFFIVCGLHLFTGLRELRFRRDITRKERHGDLILLCKVDEIDDNKAKTFVIESGERVAVFRYDGKISAVENACKHQNGPLGEGRVRNGCIVCPWHGYEYDPANGQSPPPFTEKISTYKVLVNKKNVYISLQALPPGTFTQPATII